MKTSKLLTSFLSFAGIIENKLLISRHKDTGILFDFSSELNEH